MEFFDKFYLAFGVFAGLLLVGMVATQFWARHVARGRKPILARVISVRRYEFDDRKVYIYGVDTVYEVPGHGPLTHFRGCETEGQAILFSRLHKEGSMHKVVVNAADSDKVFLWDELAKTDWYWIYFAVVALVCLGSAIYAVVEYYGD
jgi:hypothetical protein